MFEQMAEIARLKQEAMQPGTASGIEGSEQLGPLPPEEGAPPVPTEQPNPEEMPPIQPYTPMRPNPEEIV